MTRLQDALAPWVGFAQFKSARLHGLLIALMLALINGLLYVFMVPPWQHYDEPGHFEHAWLIANRPGLPQIGDFDQNMRLEVATSMIQFSFYRDLGEPPSLTQKGPANIGFPQIDNYRAYYWLAALPLRLLRNTDITLQLYAARAVSLLLLLVSIVGCWGIVQELAHPDSALCWLAPVCLALLPAYAELMTAVNNDAAATAFATLLLWTLVRLMQRGFSVGRLLGCLGWSLLCFWTKSNTFLIIASVPLALALSCFKTRGRLVIWSLLALATVLALFFATRWDDVRGWLRLGGQEAEARRATTSAHSGHYAFALASGVQLRQVIATDVAEAVRGQTVTLGAWVWAESPQTQTVYAPVLLFENVPQIGDFPTIPVNSLPAFHSYTVTVPANAGRLWLALLSPQSISATVLYDDIVLTQSGGNTSFHNAVRNPSAELGAIRFKDSVRDLVGYLLSLDINHLTGALLDPATGHDYFESTANNLAQTFWARFGWGNVTMVYPSLYPLLNALMVISIFCSLYVVLSKRTHRSLNQDQHSKSHVLFMLALLTVAIWGAAFTRGVFSLLSFWWIPGARYVYPTVVPMLLMIIGGWHSLAAQSSSSRVRQNGPILIVSFFVCLNVLSLFSITHFFAR